MSTRRFEDYYDAKWVPLNEYFTIHRRRFVDSYEFLDPFVGEKWAVADLVQPGDGPGPLAEFFALEKQAVLILITSDLREKLEVETSSCDLVLCTETIEHIKDKDSTRISELDRFNYSGIDNMLSESARILKADGHLFITTPNSSSFVTLHKWLMGELPYVDPHHVREFTVDLLNDVCARNGFVPIAIEVRNSWSHVSDDLLEQFEKLVESFPVKRNVSRAENIYALYGKRSR